MRHCVPVPSSIEIATRLAAEIAELPAGARIAGESELMRRFGVGRAAARAALQELERRLLVRRVRGSGSFVNRPLDYVISRSRRPSWHETVLAAGGRPRSVVRDVSLHPLPAVEAERLALLVGTPAHRLLRQSWVDDLLARCSEEWVPTDVVADPGAGLRVHDSLDRVLRDLGRVSPVRAWSRIGVEVPAPETVALLELDTAVPLWLVESVSRDAATGRPVMCSRAWMRADAVRLSVELGEDVPGEGDGHG